MGPSTSGLKITRYAAVARPQFENALKRELLRRKLAEEGTDAEKIVRKVPLLRVRRRGSFQKGPRDVEDSGEWSRTEGDIQERRPQSGEQPLKGGGGIDSYSEPPRRRASNEQPLNDGTTATEHKYIRRVTALDPRAGARGRPIMPPRTDTRINRFRIGLTFSYASTVKINNLREKFSKSSENTNTPLRHLKLLTGIREKYRGLCQRTLERIAEQCVPFEVRIGEPAKREIFGGEKKRGVSCPVVVEGEVVKVREKIMRELKRGFAEAKAVEGTEVRVRFGGVPVGSETEFWWERKFDPWIVICAREKKGWWEEEEELEGILEEVRWRLPNGLRLMATGLRIYWTGEEGLKTGPDALPQIVEIPFTGTVSEGEGN